MYNCICDCLCNLIVTPTRYQDLASEVTYVKPYSLTHSQMQVGYILVQLQCERYACHVTMVANLFSQNSTAI